MKVLSIFGTRPEAIKMCPLIKKMEAAPEITSVVCLTGQHREMLQQVLDVFGVNADYNLDIMKNVQTLTSITGEILNGLEQILNVEKPDLVLVHGDTTTSFAAALAAFYQKLPVGHVEAGLRTYDKYSPFPEEMNRTLTGKIAELHFSPTKHNAENLMKENVLQNIFITGNTVIDAMQTTIKKGYVFHSNQLKIIDFSAKRYILLTAHRRENWGKPHENIFNAVKQLLSTHSDIEVIYPVHPNPVVRKLAENMFGDESRVHLIEPLDVEDMHNLISQSYLIMTDSGGIQEEAPSCGKPVVVLRNETERLEAVEAGTVVLAGTDTQRVYDVVNELLIDEKKYLDMSRAVNPYGDGMASERIIANIIAWYKGKNEGK